MMMIQLGLARDDSTASGTVSRETRNKKKREREREESRR